MGDSIGDQQPRVQPLPEHKERWPLHQAQHIAYPRPAQLSHRQKYTYVDKNVIKGKLYYYKLEDIDLSGKKTMHGPICVDWNGDGIPDDEQLKTSPESERRGICPPSCPEELEDEVPL